MARSQTTLISARSNGGTGSTGSGSITVSRVAAVRQARPDSISLEMTIPQDVVELSGLRAGDRMLVTGSADGSIRAVKADRVG
jgi:hypothetical protein